MFRFLFTICFLAFFTSSHAQSINCPIDSSLIATYSTYPCDTTWTPVCGCNNVTYRNDCFASHAGISSYNSTYRTCEDITIVTFYPNPVTHQMTYRIYLKQMGGNASVFIYDVYGNLRYERYFLGISDDTENPDMSDLPSGAYVLVAVANGHYAERKFIKLQY